MTEHISPATNSAFPLDDNAGTFTLLHPFSLFPSFSGSLSLSFYLSTPEAAPRLRKKLEAIFIKGRGRVSRTINHSKVPPTVSTLLRQPRLVARSNE